MASSTPVSLKFNPANIRIGIIGLGYVGLPLAAEFDRKYAVVGFDVKRARIDELNAGYDRTREVDPADLKSVGRSFSAPTTPPTVPTVPPRRIMGLLSPRASHQSLVLIRITNHEPRATSHDPRMTNHDPRTTMHDARTTSHDPFLSIPP